MTEGEGLESELERGRGEGAEEAERSIVRPVLGACWSKKRAEKRKEWEEYRRCEGAEEKAGVPEVEGVVRGRADFVRWG